jgi:hypothetical protein
LAGRGLPRDLIDIHAASRRLRCGRRRRDAVTGQRLAAGGCLPLTPSGRTARPVARGWRRSRPAGPG